MKATIAFWIPGTFVLLLTGCTPKSADVIESAPAARGSANVEFTNAIDRHNKDLLENGVDRWVSGVLALGEYLEEEEEVVMGADLVGAVNTLNPEFLSNNYKIQRVLEGIKYVQPSGDDLEIFLHTEDYISVDNLRLHSKVSLSFTDQDDDVILMTVNEGMDVGLGPFRKDLNFVRMNKRTADMVFVYGRRNAEKEMNMRKIVKLPEE